MAGANQDELLQVQTRVCHGGTGWFSGATVVPDALTTLNQVAERIAQTAESRPIRQRLVYGGDASQARTRVEVVSWSDIQAWRWE